LLVLTLSSPYFSLIIFHLALLLWHLFSMMGNNLAASLGSKILGDLYKNSSEELMLKANRLMLPQPV